jgi:hypothetical protein
MNKKLIKLATDFLNNYYDGISKNYLSKKETKKYLLDKIKEDDYILNWVITELMPYGRDGIDYLKNYYVECVDCLILKIDDLYFKYVNNESTFEFIEVFPKTKTVIYFD